ncbi:glycosyltransferase family 4 protein [Noviherbaspirillum aridicola]|uniref:Glycosyl transferase n=1 Tax=Noviherbaspirillum aridicola TaxID=2849687 RepID=A0ABQ4Q3D5_9BURK|nr:glycosyltransferase family 4 protein [Noviherbaspirillum aridicola]GIZ51613.1 glycosyl transferase [Noviherbaspirillum aridicola]
MRILLLTRYSRMGASSRVRSLQYAEALRQMGVEVHACSLLDDDYLRARYAGQRISLMRLGDAYLRRLRLLLRASRFDVVWIEKELFPNWPAWFEALLAKAGVPYLVDYDDAIFHGYALSSNPLKRLLRNKIDHVMRRASLVVGGNRYLLDHATRAGAARVALLPTVIDIRRYTVAPDTAPAGRPVIGWIGSPTSAQYLGALLPVLARLRERFDFEFAVVGAELDTSRYPFMRCIRWQEQTEVDEIRRFDVGVMPLPDGPWEQGKCGYKLIQYMACGKPAVASPVGVNADIVKDGVTGYLAATDAQWLDALSRLLGDAPLRRCMGMRAREAAEQRYCLQVTAPQLLALLESVAQRGKERACAA